MPFKSLKLKFKMFELHKLKMRRQGGPHAERLAKHLIVAIQQMLHRVTVSEHTNNSDHNLSARRGVFKLEKGKFDFLWFIIIIMFKWIGWIFCYLLF